MNRRQLLESLLVERFQPVPKPARRDHQSAERAWQRLVEVHEATRELRDTDDRDAPSEAAS